MIFFICRGKIWKSTWLLFTVNNTYHVIFDRCLIDTPLLVGQYLTFSNGIYILIQISTFRVSCQYLMGFFSDLDALTFLDSNNNLSSISKLFLVRCYFVLCDLSEPKWTCVVFFFIAYPSFWQFLRNLAKLF